MENHGRPQSAELTKKVICLTGASPLQYCKFDPGGKLLEKRVKISGRLCCLTKNSFGANGSASCNNMNHAPKGQCMSRHEQ